MHPSRSLVLALLMCGCAMSRNAAEVLTMCYVIERNGTGMIYDYNKAAAALDMAMEHANDDIMPAGLRLTRLVKAETPEK